MIKKIKETLGQMFFSPEADGSWTNDVECSIDEEKVDCQELNPYVGVPAPVLNPLDEWFAGSYGYSEALTDKQIEYKKEQEVQQQHAAEQVKEMSDIHDHMYKLATKNTPQLGGSENMF